MVGKGDDGAERGVQQIRRQQINWHRPQRPSRLAGERANHGPPEQERRPKETSVLDFVPCARAEREIKRGRRMPGTERHRHDHPATKLMRHDFAGLEGHSVAAQPGATWFKFIVSKYHLKDVRETPATHSIANFLADSNYIQQIFVTSEPYFVKNAGADFRTMLISSAGYDPYRVFFTRKDYMEQHPDIVAKFVRATIKGWQEYLRDPGPANALILKLNPAQNPAQMEFTLHALKDGSFITGPDASGAEIGKMTPARWAATNEQLTTLGVIRKPIDPTTAYTLKFLP